MGMFLGNSVPREDYDVLLDEVEALVAENADLREAAAGTQPTEWLEAVMTRRILVHTKNNLTFDGSLMARMDDGIVLRAAKLLLDDTKSTPLPGETWVPRDNIAFAQLDG